MDFAIPSIMMYMKKNDVWLVQNLTQNLDWRLLDSTSVMQQIC